jgi:hypothetical protein
MIIKRIITIAAFILVSIACIGQIKPNRIAKFQGTIFDTDVFLVVGQDTLNARRFINFQFNGNVAKSEDFVNRGMTFYHPGLPIILWIPNPPRSVEELAVLNHEIFHVVTSLLEWAGVPLCEQTEEVYAYTLQYYTRVIYLFVQKL